MQNKHRDLLTEVSGHFYVSYSSLYISSYNYVEWKHCILYIHRHIYIQLPNRLNLASLLFPLMHWEMQYYMLPYQIHPHTHTHAHTHTHTHTFTLTSTDIYTYMPSYFHTDDFSSYFLYRLYHALHILVLAKSIASLSFYILVY